MLHNRVSTTEVADALGKKGVVEDVKPVNRGHYRAGIIRCILDIWFERFDKRRWMFLPVEARYCARIKSGRQIVIIKGCE